MNIKIERVYFFITVLFFLLLTSCSQEKPVEIEYSFTAAKNVNYDVNDFEKVKFEPFNDLNLGFFRGNVWIKLEITNSEKTNISYMFVSNDRFNRNYVFYKLDTASNSFKLTSQIKDLLKEDYRTYNSPNPNLKIDLLPSEHAIYLITSSSDGRTKDATPQIISLKNYYDFNSENTILGIIFYSVVVFLLLINVYLWSIYKDKIYLYYIFYIISTLFVYLGIEGYLLCLKINQIIIDHFVFIGVKLWVLSLIMYTSKFFDLEVIAPKYYRFIKTTLIVVIGGILLYQFIFFYSSIQYLHYFENLLIPLWLLLIVGILIVSSKDKWLELKYYLIPLSCFILLTVFGVVNVHLQIFAGNSFTYVKLGAIFEFIGFTYFVTALIKRKINKAETLEQDLKEKEELLSKKIESTDLVSIFNLIENSLSTENEWQEFQLKLKELTPNFLNNLLEKHPDLSKSEIRLITLIKLGYSQKDIANTLNIAPDSVKKARSRVRKKLQLSESDKLSEYLSNL